MSVAQSYGTRRSFENEKHLKWTLAITLGRFSQRVTGGIGLAASKVARAVPPEQGDLTKTVVH